MTETEEVARLRGMIQYALAAPDDAQAIKSILYDALNGCTGADNLTETRARHGTYEGTEHNAEALAAMFD